MNSRPITTIDSDPSDPMVLTPNILLTHKQGDVPRHVDTLCLKDTYKSQWKHVQVLSDNFWKKWRNEYLTQLQTRQKWHQTRPNRKPGNAVLLRENSLHRNNWPLGIIANTTPSEDNLVRKATLKVFKDGKTVTYTRPISEMVLLLDNLLHMFDNINQITLNICCVYISL